MADRVSDNLAMLMRVVDRLAPLQDFAVVKIGFRVPSLKKRIRARTSWKRALRHRAGLKAPRGWGLGDESKEGGLQPGLPADDTRVPGGAADGWPLLACSHR